MKKKIIILSILTVCLFKICFGQTDTTLQKILAINYPTYNGKTVGKLVQALPKNYTRIRVLGHHRGDYGDELALFYPDDICIAIRVKKFKYMNPILNKSKPFAGQWDVNLFKKETMAFAIVYQGASCLVGCVNDPRSTAP